MDSPSLSQWPPPLKSRYRSRNTSTSFPLFNSRIPRIYLLLAFLTLLSIVSGRSPHPPPIRRIHHPSRSSLQILPRKAPSPNPLSRPRSFLPQSPPPHTLLHSDTILLSLSLPTIFGSGEDDIYLLLRPTEDLLHPFARSISDNGQSTLLKPDTWRLYQGEVITSKWVDRRLAEETLGIHSGKGKIGSASVMIHRPGEDDTLWEGNFVVDGTTYHVLTKEKYERVKGMEDVGIMEEEMGEMVVFRDIDTHHHDHQHESNHHSNGDHEGKDHSCSHDSLAYNSNTSHPIWSNRHAPSFSLFEDFNEFNRHIKRDDISGQDISSNFIDSINNTAGCPSTQQIVYMGVALDCNYVATYGGPDAARTQVLNVWNQASALYRNTFNISLGIVELLVMNETCSSNPGGQSWNVGCDRNLTLDTRLSLFSQWRGSKGNDGAGLWHLMSACPTDSEVGVAWLGTLCQQTSNSQGGTYVSGTGISTASRTEWSLVSHEIGHGFGAIHDCTSGCSLTGSCCPFSKDGCDSSGKYIMNPTTSTLETSFSGCTLGNICSNIGSRAISTSCIQSPGARSVISLQQCGNGIVEPANGEECDPGSNSTSTCCDPSTCKFRTGAVCDPTNSACCTPTCQFASSGTICRPSIDSTCDIAETCTGQNSTCPVDKTEPDGKSCGNNGLACASGRCTSLNQQCATAGKSMGLTSSCGQRDDTSCVVSCRDPRNSNQCIVLQTPLLDGSPCGYGGHCYNQTCQSGPWQEKFAAMYTQNLQISIPVTIVVGIIILLLLVAIARCIWRCCTGGAASTRKGTGRQNRTPRTQNNRNTMAGLPPPPMRQSNLPPPPPPGQGGPPIAPYTNQRNSSSWTSQDPLAQPPPPPVAARPPSNYRASEYFGENPGQQDYLSGQGQRHSGQAPVRQSWVDERMYNGPYYGQDEAYGGRR